MYQIVAMHQNVYGIVLSDGDACNIVHFLMSQTPLVLMRSGGSCRTKSLRGMKLNTVPQPLVWKAVKHHVYQRLPYQLPEDKDRADCARNNMLLVFYVADYHRVRLLCYYGITTGW